MTMRRFREAFVVFAVFEVAGVASTFVIAALLKVELDIRDVILRVLSFGIAGCISWMLLCRRDLKMWPLAGILTGILAFPAAMIGYFVGMTVLGNPWAFDELSDEIKLMLFITLALCHITIPHGLAGAFVCNTLLKRMRSNTPVDGTDA